VLALAREGTDIVVADVLPTDETVAKIHAMKRRALGLHCAEAVLFLASPAANYITGQSLNVDVRSVLDFGLPSPFVFSDKPTWVCPYDFTLGDRYALTNEANVMGHTRRLQWR